MSKSLATKNVAAVLLAVSMIFGVMFTFATPARAQTLESLQAQIQALLAQIAALQGGGSQQTGGLVCATFTRNHSMGNSGGEVMAIQKFLNSVDGTQLATTGAGSPGNETSYFGSITKAAVVKFQNKFAADILAPVGLSAGTGYWGPSSRAKANSLCAGGGVVTPGPGVPITGNGLKVMLAADSPVNVALVAGQAIGELGKFTFSNPTGSTINVTNLAFMRIGVSNDATLEAVYLYEGAARLTDSAGVSNSAFSFNDSAGLFSLAPGQSRSISVRSDIDTGTSGQQVGVQLNSVAASGALDTTVVLPITGGIQTVSAATLATADFGGTTLPSATAVAPQDDYVVWQNTVTIGTRAVDLQSFQLRNIGSIDNDDIKNLQLFVDGVQVGNTLAQLNSGEASLYWDLTGAPKRLETGGRVIKVVGDIVGGSNSTFQFSLRRAGDARFVDTDLNQPILATAAGSAFSARSATSATIDVGTVSVVKAANSLSSAVAPGISNVKWATFEMRAAGEDVKVESLNVNANTSADRGLDNGKVFFNGVQVGSTKDLTDATDIEFTFGSSMILKAGEVGIVDIYADAKSTTGAAFVSGETAAITLDDGSSNGLGQVSLTSLNIPSSDLAANTVTLTSAALTASKASGYGDQTMIAGTSNAKLGSFTLSASATEGVNVNTIVVTLSTDEAATITDMRLVDNATGTQIGTTKPTLGATNTYSVNFNIPASGSKTIDIVGNIKSGSNAGTWTAVITSGSGNTGGTGLTTGNAITVGTDLTLQTITVGTGTFTTAVGAGNPDSLNVVAGTSDVQAGSFTFTTQNSSFKVEELKVLIPADAATSVASVKLRYKNSLGATEEKTGSLTLSSGAQQTHATATFTGLDFFIPADDSGDVDVLVNIPTLSSGASSGKTISVLIDNGVTDGFRAVDSSGTATTTLDGADLDGSATAGSGDFVVRGSIPTLSSTPITDALVAGSDQVIGRFTVSANSGGSMGWRKAVFAINKTAAVTLDATTTVKLYRMPANVSVAGSFSTTTGSQANQSQMFTTTATSGDIIFIADSEQQLAAGASQLYELRTTVGGLAAGSNLSVRIANPNTTSATSTTFANMNAGGAGNATNTFVWTDRSATSHSATTADWTNDYLVKSLPLPIGNRNVAF